MAVGSTRSAAAAMIAQEARRMKKSMNRGNRNWVTQPEPLPQ
jgi:hypothetical protein